MPREICLTHKLFLAVFIVAYMGIRPTGIVGFHVRLEIIASAEELAANGTFVVCLVRGRKLPSLADSGSVGNQ